MTPRVPRRIVMADTCAVLAGYDQGDPQHKDARHVLDHASTLVMSPLVLAELDHMGRERIGREDTMLMLDELQRNMESERLLVPQLTAQDLQNAQRVRRAYPGLRLDLADATIVALSVTWATTTVFTVDQRDFRQVQPPGRKGAHYTLWPADL